MSMTFRYINATGSHTFDVDLGTSAVRLGSIGSGLAQRAELGQPGMGAIEIDDPGGALNILGYQWFSVTESLAPAGSNTVFRGFIDDREVKRGDAARASLRTGADRVWSLTLADFNTILTLRLVDSGSRPAETASARLHWLLGLANCPVADYGWVTYPTHAMDAHDYTDATFNDVLTDIITAPTYNYWADWDEAHGGIGLWVIDPNGPLWTTSARISNVLADIDQTTTFYSLEGQATLKRSPQRIASKVVGRYTGGRVTVSDASVADLYTNAERVAPMGTVKTASAATAVAGAFLNQSRSEDDRITTTIRVPAAHVNDIRAGHLMSVKFSHLPGYTSFTPCRVMSRAPLQNEESDQFYNLALELTPQLGPVNGGVCTLNPSIANTPSGSYPPLLGTLTDAAGNVWYTSGNQTYFLDTWQFWDGPRPHTNCNGLGFPFYNDPAGYDSGAINVSSVVGFVFSGAGLMTVPWAIGPTTYSGHIDIQWYLKYLSAGGIQVQDTGAFISPFTFTYMTPALPGDATSCWRILEMWIRDRDPVGVGSGEASFGGVTWTLALA